MLPTTDLEIDASLPLASADVLPEIGSPSPARVVSLVVPVLNEEDAIPIFLSRTAEVEMACRSAFRVPIIFEYVFVNDGSTDSTIDVLMAERAVRKRIVVVDLSRNFGKEAALTAGIDAATGHAVVPIDVDLQDPPALILEMIRHWLDGSEVVVGKRSERSEDGFLKRTTARWFYQVHNVVSRTKIPSDVGDFRLMDRVVVDAIKRLPENRRFMKGLFAWVGFRTTTVEYAREARKAGVGKFSGWSLWTLAIEGITSFSAAPLVIWTYVGFFVSLLSFMTMFVVMIQKLFFGMDIPGYAALFVAVLFLGGVQLIGIGMLGEYLARVYAEVKGRPIYVVRRKFGS